MFSATRPEPDPRRLRRILLINCVADVGYLALAAAAWRKGRTGDGAAIAVQGAFLLAFLASFDAGDAADGEILPDQVVW